MGRTRDTKVSCKPQAGDLGEDVDRSQLLEVPMQKPETGAHAQAAPAARTCPEPEPLDPVPPPVRLLPPLLNSLSFAFAASFYLMFPSERNGEAGSCSMGMTLDALARKRPRRSCLLSCVRGLH